MSNTKIIESIVTETLSLKTVDRSANLVEYGLDSILLVQIIAQVEKKIGIKLNIDKIKERPTICNIDEQLSHK